MGDASETQRGRQGRDAPPDASRKPTTNPNKGPQHPEDSDAIWRHLIDCLTDVERDLTSPDPQPGHTLSKIREALSTGRALWKQAKRNPPDERLARIEGMLNTLVDNKEKQKQKEKTWANVAAQATRIDTACPPQRHSVRLRMPGAQGQTPDEILQTVRPAIKGAYAIRTLRSGDIDVMVPDQAAKDAALNQQETEDFKILRQDYPVEVPSVPLALSIAEGKNANNSGLIADITTATRKILPNITITRIRWLHTAKEHATRTEAGKSKGTVIISFPTQAIQHEVVKKGIIIQSQLYEARLYNHGTQVKQCFNCNQWGHTQSACAKQPRCGECAGSHQTKECPKEKVSCANCGRPHRAWQKKECQVYRTYSEEIQAKRVALYTLSASIRQAGPSQATLRTDGFEIVSNKRRRAASPPAKKGAVGRPTYITVASRDPSQTRLRMLQTHADNSTQSSEHTPTSSTPAGSSQGEPADTIMTTPTAAERTNSEEQL